jgi:integrase
MIKTIGNSNGIVRFAFKEARKLLETDKKKESLIFLHFSYGGYRFKYSTGYKSCFMDWDFDKQRIKQSKVNIINAIEVNEFLSNIENVVKKEYSRLIAEHIVVSNLILKDFLDSYLNKNVKVDNSKPKTFFDFSDEFLEVKSKEISIITLRSYKQSLIKLKNYSNYYKEKINFNSFNKEFVINFIAYLEEVDYSHNTISKHIKNLKVLIKHAFDKGMITNTDFSLSYFSLRPEETTAIYLDEAEIELMHNLDLSDKKNLEIARDIFLIGCYTGQRISDYNGIDKNCIKKIESDYYFSFRQKKTKKSVNCYITPKIREILDLRYN